LSAAGNQSRPSSYFKAIALLLGAMLSLLSLDACGKWLGGQQVPVALTTWARYTGHFVLAVLFFAPRVGLGALFKTSNARAQIARGLCMVAVTLIYFQALKSLPLAEATALFYITPVLAVLMAWLFLNEAVPIRAWLSVGLGFVGVLIVGRPGLSSADALPLVGMALVLLAACGNAAYQTLTRLVSGSDSVATQLVYAAAVGCTVMTASMFWWWQPVQLDITIVGVLVATGALGSLGHWLLIRAFLLAPAGVLSPWMFLQLLFSIGLGWMIFAQVPDATALVGMALVGITPWLARRR
jgi:drug/metabolite transporter (DMT)-like permease